MNHHYEEQISTIITRYILDFRSIPKWMICFWLCSAICVPCRVSHFEYSILIVIINNVVRSMNHLLVIRSDRYYFFILHPSTQYFEQNRNITHVVIMIDWDVSNLRVLFVMKTVCMLFFVLFMWTSNELNENPSDGICRSNVVSRVGIVDSISWTRLGFQSISRPDTNIVASNISVESRYYKASASEKATKFVCELWSWSMRLFENVNRQGFGRYRMDYNWSCMYQSNYWFTIRIASTKEDME